MINMYSVKNVFSNPLFILTFGSLAVGYIEGRFFGHCIGRLEYNCDISEYIDDKYAITINKESLYDGDVEHIDINE